MSDHHAPRAHSPARPSRNHDDEQSSPVTACRRCRKQKASVSRLLANRLQEPQDIGVLIAVPTVLTLQIVAMLKRSSNVQEMQRYLSGMRVSTTARQKAASCSTTSKCQSSCPSRVRERFWPSTPAQLV